LALGFIDSADGIGTMSTEIMGCTFQVLSCVRKRSQRSFDLRMSPHAWGRWRKDKQKSQGTNCSHQFASHQFLLLARIPLSCLCSLSRLRTTLPIRTPNITRNWDLNELLQFNLTSRIFKRRN
jgi:hypothetical protein